MLAARATANAKTLPTSRSCLRRGLRTRGNRRHPARPLSANRVHELLANPYYVGTVSYPRQALPGRHEPLVSQELFDQVQAVLRTHHLSGERDRKHKSYLKGTIRCGTCGSRLVSPATRATADTTNTSSVRATSAAPAPRATGPSTS